MAPPNLPLSLTVNGQRIQLDCEPARRVVDVLREDLGLTGTKIGCEIGVCGACTVLLDGVPVSACLTLAFQVSGRELRTVEGLATHQSLHPVQSAMIETGGFQCGFCTPGQIVAAVALLEQTMSPTDEEILTAMSGNLCRCTGYYPIIAAIRLAATRMQKAAEAESATASGKKQGA